MVPYYYCHVSGITDDLESRTALVTVFVSIITLNEKIFYINWPQVTGGIVWGSQDINKEANFDIFLLND